MTQFPNTFEQMMMLDRQRIASFDDALLRNLRLMGSDVPIGNTTFSPGIGFNAPTMFSQVLQGIGGTFGDTAAQTIGLVSGLIQNPAIAPMLGPIPGYLNTIQGLPPIGGAVDPGGFAYAQLYKRIASGREVPQIAPPSNFSNRQAIDAYNEQLQNLDYYMMRPSRPEQRLLLPAQNATENMQLATAFENISRMQQQDRNFQNMFALFNEVMPGDRAAAISPDIQAQIRQAAVRGDEATLGNLLQDPNIRGVLDRQASMAKNASAMLGVSSMLSNFVGSSSAETAQVQGLGDILRQVLKLDQPGVMTAATTQSLAAMGNLGIAQTTTMGPQGAPETRSVVGQVAAALQERIRMSGIDAQTRGQGSGFFGMQAQGFERTGQLLQELQSTGMLTTGGVDIFNAVKPEDVKKMEAAIANQLESFSEIAKAGRRMGMQIPEITRNLQSIYGGRLPQVLREQAMGEMAGVQAQEMTLVERARERGVSEEAIGLTGSQQRQQFLELEAQRRAGTTMMQQLEKAVELGRFAGIDTRGVMAMASTVTQVTRDMGLTGEASVFLTQDALSRVALSRQMGEPITASQSLAISAGIAERGMKNTSVRAFAALKKAMKDGLPMPQADVDAMIQKFNNNELVDPDVVSNMIRNAGGIPGAYMSERALRAAQSDPEVMAAVRARFSSDQALSVTGTMQRMFESGGASTDTLVSTVGTNRELAKTLGIEGDVNFTSIAAAYNRLETPMAQRAFLTQLEAALPQDQARQITGAFRSILGANTNNISVVGDNGVLSPANVILQEEDQRRRFGGQTRAEIGAQAVVDVKRRIEQEMGSGGQSAIADAFKSMMDREVSKAAEAIKTGGVAGLSEPELAELGRVRATQSVARDVASGAVQLTDSQKQQLANLRGINPADIGASLTAKPVTVEEAQSLIASKDIDIAQAAKTQTAQAIAGLAPLTEEETRQLAERRAAGTSFGIKEVLQGLAGTDMGKFTQVLSDQLKKVTAELDATKAAATPEAQAKRTELQTEVEQLKAQAKALRDALKEATDAAGQGQSAAGRALRVTRDSNRQMSSADAKLKAEAQGVDLETLGLELADDESLLAGFDSIEEGLRTKAKEKYMQLGAPEDKAQAAADVSSFSYADVEREITSSNLSDENKAKLKARLEDFKRLREQAIAAGERVEDLLTNKETEYGDALKLSEVTLKDLAEADRRLGASAGVGRRSTTEKIPDSGYSMSEDAAKAAVEAEGINPTDVYRKELSGAYGRDRDYTPAMVDAIQKANQELTLKAAKAFEEQGVSPAEARSLAGAANFKYEDFMAALEKTGLDAQSLETIKQKLDTYKEQRLDEKVIGEYTGDKATGVAVDPKLAVDLDKATEDDVRRIRSNTEVVATPTTTIDPRIQEAAAKREAELQTELAKKEQEIAATEANLQNVSAAPANLTAKQIGLETQQQNLQSLLASINRFGPDSSEAKAAVDVFIKSLGGPESAETQAVEASSTAPAGAPQQSFRGTVEGTPVDGGAAAVTTAPSASTPKPPTSATQSNKAVSQPPELLARPEDQAQAAEVNPTPVAVAPKSKAEAPPSQAMTPNAANISLGGEQVNQITSYLKNEMDKKLVGIQQELASLATHIRTRST